MPVLLMCIVCILLIIQQKVYIDNQVSGSVSAEELNLKKLRIVKDSGDFSEHVLEKNGGSIVSMHNIARLPVAIIPVANSTKQIGEVMASLFHLAPPDVSYKDWNTPSSVHLTHAEFMNHPFSSSGSHPYPALDRCLRQVTTWPGGFFIESGGHNGLFQSTTLALEQNFGWRGLLIEPSLINVELIRANRKRSGVIHAGLVSSMHDGSKISDPGGSPMGEISVGRGNVSGRAFSPLLDDLNISQVDLWSLDVEGYEVPVLQGVDFNRHRPKFVLIEVWSHNKENVFSIMSSNKYNLVPGYDVEGGISGFPKGHVHRDYLWTDSFLQGPSPKIHKPL